MQALSASQEKKASGELVTVGDRKNRLGEQMERGQD